MIDPVRRVSCFGRNNVLMAEYHWALPWPIQHVKSTASSALLTVDTYGNI